MLEFDIVDKHQNKTRHSLAAGEYSVGKGDQCDIIINDPHVSRVHALIKVAADQAVFTDQGSTNGTWLDGKRISAPVKLVKGAVLSFGELRIVVSEAPGVVEPTPNQSEFSNVDRRGLKSKSVQESEELIATKRRIHSLILEYLDLRKRNNLEEMSVEELRSEAQKATHEIIKDRVEKIPEGITRA